MASYQWPSEKRPDRWKWAIRGMREFDHTIQKLEPRNDELAQGHVSVDLESLHISATKSWIGIGTAFPKEK